MQIRTVRTAPSQEESRPDDSIKLAQTNYLPCLFYGCSWLLIPGDGTGAHHAETAPSLTSNCSQRDKHRLGPMNGAGHPESQNADEFAMLVDLGKASLFNCLCFEECE